MRTSWPQSSIITTKKRSMMGGTVDRDDAASFRTNHNAALFVSLRCCTGVGTSQCCIDRSRWNCSKELYDARLLFV